MLGFANHSCEEHSLMAESASLKSKARRGGWDGVFSTPLAPLNAAAYWAAQSFTLGRALSITTDWLCKSLGRRHKHKERWRGRRRRGKRGRREAEIVIKPHQFLSVRTWKREVQVNGGCLQWKIRLILVVGPLPPPPTPTKPLKVLKITTSGCMCWESAALFRSNGGGKATEIRCWRRSVITSGGQMSRYLPVNQHVSASFFPHLLHFLSNHH